MGEGWVVSVTALSIVDKLRMLYTQETKWDHYSQKGQLVWNVPRDFDPCGFVYKFVLFVNFYVIRY